jgi:hypothetical protein
MASTRRANFTKEDLERMAALYESGLPTSEIGAIMGCEKSSVAKALKKFGVTPRIGSAAYKTRSRIKNQEEIIGEFREAHGDRYDYSKVKYAGTKAKIIIICRRHGEFSMTPNSHQQGQGCPKCGRESFKEKVSYGLEDFLAKAKKAHAERYDYSTVVFNSFQESVEITCPNHGVFKQNARAHTRGNGCPECAYEASLGEKLYLRATKEEALEKFAKAHADKYNYSKAEYISSKEKIEIICRRHGSFWQTPEAHASGRGCKTCANETAGSYLKYSLKRLLNHFRECHEEEYDYKDLVDTYEGNFDALVDQDSITRVRCRDHGYFNQNIRSHVSGKTSCRQCASLRISKALSLDLTEKRFGKLTVLCKVDRPTTRKQQASYWKVQCSCGSETYVLAAHQLTSGKAGECPKCSRRTMSRKLSSRVPCLMGERFGRLLVLRDWGTTKGGNRNYLCQCDCGKQTTVVMYALKSGGISSCGCKLKESPGGDTFTRFVNDSDWAGLDCYFYLADISDELVKPGIASDLDRRAWQGKYRKYIFVSPRLTRAEAWVIEQLILEETLDAKPAETPEEMEEMMGGQSELRHRYSYKAAWYQMRFHQLLEKLHEYGWESLYLNSDGLAQS